MVSALIGRSPKPSEKEILLLQYEEEKVYFEDSPKEVRKFLNIGAKKTTGEIRLTETAALARVANTILNSTESYYKN